MTDNQEDNFCKTTCMQSMERILTKYVPEPTDISSSHPELLTGIAIVDDAMRNLNSSVYPKLTRPLLLLRGVKEHLSLPFQQLTVEELLLGNRLPASSSSKKSNELEICDRLYQLALHMIHGKLFKQDVIYAAVLLKRAAEMSVVGVGSKDGRSVVRKNLGKAQAALAALYVLGIGVMQSFVLGAYWYSRAMKMGYSDVVSQLGLFHLLGLGVQKSYTKANNFFKTRFSVHLSELTAKEDPRTKMDIMILIIENGDIKFATEILSNILNEYSRDALSQRSWDVVDTLADEISNLEEFWNSTLITVGNFERKFELLSMNMSPKMRLERQIKSSCEPYKSVISNSSSGKYGTVFDDWNKYPSGLFQRALSGSLTADWLLTVQLNALSLENYLYIKQKDLSADHKKVIVNKLYECYELYPNSVSWTNDCSRRCYMIFKQELVRIPLPTELQKLSKEEQDILLEHERKYRVCRGYLEINQAIPSVDLELFLKQTVEKYPHERLAYEALSLYQLRKENFKECIEVAEEGLRFYPKSLILLYFKASSLFEIYRRGETCKPKAYPAAETYETILNCAPDCFPPVRKAFSNIEILQFNVHELVGMSDVAILREYFADILANLPDTVEVTVPCGCIRESNKRKKMNVISSALNKQPTCKRPHPVYVPDITRIATDFKRSVLVTSHRRSQSEKLGSFLNEKQNFAIKPLLYSLGDKVPNSYREIDISSTGNDTTLERCFVRVTIIDEPIFFASYILLVADDDMGNSFMINVKNVKKEPNTFAKVVFGSRFYILAPKFSYIAELAEASGCMVNVLSPSNFVYCCSIKDPCRYCLKEGATYICRKCNWAKYCDTECLHNDLNVLKHDIICKK